MNPTCIFHESEDVYHSRSKSGDYLSSHMLKTFQQMPYKYYATISGLYQEPEKMEYAIGTAAHKLILEGKEAFDAAYTIAYDAPINEKTGKPYGTDTKKYQEWLALQDKNVISIEDFEEIAAMNKNVIDHPIAPEILRPGGVAEGVVRAELEGVPCQIRMDYFHPDVGIIDLKTCRDITFFEYDMRNLSYIFQFAFYRMVLRAASGSDYPFYALAVDKTPFHICGIWQIPDAEIEIAERINLAAIRRFRECRETNKWPTGYERKQIFTFNK